MNEILKYPNSDMVLENIILLMQDQPPRDRMGYKEIALEASLSPAGKSKLIQKLYTDIISKSNIDYGKIPDSRGNITKYVYYDPMYKSIETLNQLFGDKTVYELELTNKLHDFIITCRSDFEFGYKFDVEIIKITYNLLVLSLHEMINVCIVEYTNYLKDVKNIDFQFNTKQKKNRLIVKYVKDTIKSYEKGEWTKLMMQFKKDSSNLLGLSGVIGIVTGTTTLSGGVLVVIALLGLLFAIRGLIYIFFNTSYRVNDYIKTEAELLKWNIEMDNNTSDSALEKQKKFLGKLEETSDFIETRILKTEAKAKKELAESNKQIYSKDELSTVSSSDLELL